MEKEVQHLIESQPNGIKISDMEKTLRQSRLRLGYVTKKLLDEGKVRKVDNKYYSITNQAPGVESTGE